jgi:hypothetical protein
MGSASLIEGFGKVLFALQVCRNEIFGVHGFGFWLGKAEGRLVASMVDVGR